MVPCSWQRGGPFTLASDTAVGQGGEQTAQQCSLQRPTLLIVETALAWFRFWIVVLLRERTFPTVFAALDATFQLVGGASTSVLNDNEKSVTDGPTGGSRDLSGW